MPATAPVSIDRSPTAPRTRRRLPTWLLSLIGLLGGMLTVALFVIRLTSGQPEAPTAAGPGEIFLEPAAATGPDPFTPSVATTSPTATGVAPSPSASASSAPALTPGADASGAIAVRTIPGGTVGLYGGTKNNAECDKAQMIAFLEQNPDKAAAWAAVHGIPASEIRAYIEGLTPVVLQRDARVTNHGFRDGAADARQSVLQAGTAVLLDDRGVPRARCRCGNPLLEPIPAPTTPTYTGDAWPNFAPERVEVIVPAPAPLAQIPVVDTQTGDVFARPPGTEGPGDTAYVASASPMTSESPVTTEAPSVPPSPSAPPGPGPGDPVAREPLFDSDLTAIGAIAANSVDPNFPANLAVDLDASTSWFSIGPHTPTTVTEYTWAVDAPVAIEAVVIVGNAEHQVQAFRTGFGFEQVDVDVILGGLIVTTVTQPLAGTPDPNLTVTLPAGTMGDAVRLRFTRHESLACGGVSEVLVMGPGWEADLERAIAEGFDLFGD